MYHVTLKVHPAILSAESARAWLKFLAEFESRAQQAGWLVPTEAEWYGNLADR